MVRSMGGGATSLAVDNPHSKTLTPGMRQKPTLHDTINVPRVTRAARRLTSEPVYYDSIAPLKSRDILPVKIPPRRRIFTGKKSPGETFHTN